MAYGNQAFCLPQNRRRQSTGAPDAKDVARFWSYVDKRGPEECWPWLGHKRGGYGNFWLKGCMVNAHRAVFLISGIAAPVWPTVVDHICRNKACVNPAHLRFVGQHINTLENSDSPHAKNKAKTHCPQGHPYAGENLAIRRTTGRNGNPREMRVCLTCFPANWRHAVIPRPQPPKGYAKRKKP